MTTIKTYRQAQRDVARENSAFMPRTNGGFYSTVSGPNKAEPLIFLDESQLMMMDVVGVKPLNRALARDLMMSTYSKAKPPELQEPEYFKALSTEMSPVDSLLFTDRRALRAFRDLAGNNTDPFGEDNYYAGPLGAFDLLSKLKFAQSQKVLTEILTHRWWLPSGMTERDISSWVSAPSISGATLAAKLRELEKMARYDESTALWVGHKDFLRVEKVEQSIFVGANYGGVNSNFSRLSDMRTHKANTNVITYRTPGTQDELALNGTMTRASVIATGSKEASLMLEGSSKLSVDKMVDNLRYDGTLAGARNNIVEVTAQDGRTVFEVTGTMGNLVSVGDLVYLYETPFTGSFTKAGDKRWTSKDAYEGPGKLNVPFDIATAGSY